MSTYEEMQIILTIALLIVAILNLENPTKCVTGAFCWMLRNKK